MKKYRFRFKHDVTNETVDIDAEGYNYQHVALNMVSLFEQTGRSWDSYMFVLSGEL